MEKGKGPSHDVQRAGDVFGVGDAPLPGSASRPDEGPAGTCQTCPSEGLSQEDWESLARSFKRGGLAARAAADTAVRGLRRLVAGIASSYATDAADMEDLSQEGYLALLDALTRYDELCGPCFTLFAACRIRARVRGMAARRWSRRELARKAFPALDDSARRADREARESSCVLPDEEGWMCGASGGATPSPMEALESKEREKAFHDGVGKALRHLERRERYVLKHRILRDEPETLEHVARRLKVSAPRACQIQGRALERLRREVLDLDGLPDGLSTSVARAMDAKRKLRPERHSRRQGRTA